MKKKLDGYYVGCLDEVESPITFVVARTSREAKIIGWNHLRAFLLDIEPCVNDAYLLVKVKKAKDVNIEGLYEGFYIDYEDDDVNTMCDILRRNIYSQYIYSKCPLCKKEDMIIYLFSDNETVGCSNCEVE